MSDVFKTLLNLRSLRAIAREEFTLEQLREALEKLQTVVSEREEAEAECRQAEKEKEERLQAYRDLWLRCKVYGRSDYSEVSPPKR